MARCELGMRVGRTFSWTAGWILGRADSSGIAEQYTGRGWSVW